MNSPKSDIANNKRVRKRRILLWVLVFILVILAGLVTATKWVNRPEGTAWASKKISEALDTEVSIDSIHVGLLGKVYIHEFLIRDHHQDTLIYANDLETNLRSMYAPQSDKRLNLGHVDIGGGFLNLKVYKTESRDNLRMTFNKNPEGTNTTPADPFTMDVRSVNLTNFTFRNINENQPFVQKYFLRNAELKVEEILLDKGSIHLESAQLNGLVSNINIDPLDQGWRPERGEEESEPSDDQNVQEIPDSLQRKFNLRIDDLTIQEGAFELHNYARTPVWNGTYERVNYDHLKINDLSLHTENFKIDGLDFFGTNSRMSFVTPFGFELSSLVSDSIAVTDTRTVLHGIQMETPYSLLKDSIEFKYREYTDWRYFNDKVFIDAQLRGSKLAFRDIMHFAPALYDNTFFINAENQSIDISGRLVGRVNSLKGRDLKLNIGDEIVFDGDISSRDLATKNQQFFGAEIDMVKMDILSLENLLPNFKLPPNFEKLQDIRYRGRFDGYPLDFVTFGKLNSALGNADLDMRLDLKGGRASATYSGKLGLVDFNLQKWTGDDDFGNLSMTVQVKEGKGFNLDNAEVSLSGAIDKLEYRDYSYNDVDVNGELSKSAFDGSLSSRSESADFDFTGVISGLDSVPEYRFAADIRTIRMADLNLTKKKFDFGGRTQVSFRGLNWNELIGSGGTQNFWMIYDQRDTLNLDSIFISHTESANARNLKVVSEEGSLQMEGVYDLPSVHMDFLSILQSNHPKLMNFFSLKDYGRRDSFKLEYRLKLDMDDDKGIVKYFSNDKLDIRKGTIDGKISLPNQNINLVVDAPIWTVNGTELTDTEISLVNDKELMIYNGTVASLSRGGKEFISTLETNGNFAADKGKSSLTFVDPKGIIDDINLNAEFEPQGKNLKLILDPAYFRYSGETWRFFPGNSVVIGKKSLQFEDFVLSSFNQVLKLDDINDGTGVVATAEGINSDILDSLLHLKGFDFGGRLDARFEVGDLYKFENIELDVSQSDLLINDRSEGNLNVKLKGKNIKEGFSVDLSLTDQEKSLFAKGVIADEGYNVDIGLEQFPLITLEDIITSGIKGTFGDVTGNVELRGKKGDFGLFGTLLASGGTTVDYIGVEYRFEDQKVQFNDGKLDFSGVSLKDTLGNAAKITGYLEHQSLKDWSMNLNLASSRLLMLNTNPVMNPDYYGTVIGNGRVEFTGTFNRPSIYVAANTMAGSNLVIPVGSGIGGASSDFVEFVKRDTITTEETSSGLIEGLKLDMNLGITESADMKIIFDEQAGDILEGNGRGSMVVAMNRAGDLSVYGDYEIERGEYLFTLLNFVNKPFEVQRGGRIRWTGDPIDALVNLSATYKDLYASPYPLVQEFSDGNDDLSAAQRSTKVDLLMNLRGSLLRPVIDFDIQLPELVGEVKTYAENKLQILRNDPQELNKQVFGLVVFNSFFPTGNDFVVNSIGSNSVNTLSEFLSTQLSVFVSGLLNNIVQEVGFISGVDVDLAYIQRYDIESNSNTLEGGEYQFRVRNRLWNDRWVVTLGGNYGNQSISASGDPYFNPETAIEWNTPVRGLKLRAYYRGEDSLQGQRQLVGGGIRYRKEFDSFSEFFDALRKKESNENKN